MGATFFEALVKAIQCALEEFDCIEYDLQIKTTSLEIGDWLTKGDQRN